MALNRRVSNGDQVKRSNIWLQQVVKQYALQAGNSPNAKRITGTALGVPVVDGGC
jgi:hypothetical protein